CHDGIIGLPARIANPRHCLVAPPRGRVAVSAAFAPFHFRRARFCCRSSVVEHPLGKGEVECSIHSGSTSKISTFSGLHGAPRYGRFSLGYTVGYTDAPGARPASQRMALLAGTKKIERDLCPQNSIFAAAQRSSGVENSFDRPNTWQ